MGGRVGPGYIHVKLYMIRNHLGASARQLASGADLKSPTHPPFNAVTWIVTRAVTDARLDDLFCKAKLFPSRS